MKNSHSVKKQSIPNNFYYFHYNNKASYTDNEKITPYFCRFTDIYSIPNLDQ